MTRWLSTALVVGLVAGLAEVTRSQESYDYEVTTNDDAEDILDQDEDEITNGDKAAVPWSSLCPPPIQPPSCGAPSCSDNNDCAIRHNNTYLCCFNGCVQTCMRALDPPLVFDWIEDPPDVINIKGGEVAPHSSPPESVALPGGCLLSEAEFHNLERFKQNKYVSHCFCDIGGVFCKIVH